MNSVLLSASMAARFVVGLVPSFVKACVDVSKFLGYCRTCPNYNKRWSCPPYGFSVEAVWNRYSNILLYLEKVPISLGLRNRTYAQEELTEACNAIVRPVKKQMAENLLVLETQIPGSKALFAGTCEMCDSCNKSNGEFCMHPEMMRYSIESLGGNVVQAVQLYFDEKVLWAKDGHLPEFFILLGGLLLQ